MNFNLPHAAWFIVVLFFISTTFAKEEELLLLPLQQYRLIYFLVGTPDTKIQFSFQIQFIEPINLYFGYTQIMMWDITKLSSPMRDLNYNPELFYRFYIKKKSFQWINIGIIEHESNGRDSEISRAWNRAYILYHSARKIGEQIKMEWSIKGWIPFGYGLTNEDLSRYRGAWELQIALNNIINSSGTFFGANDLMLRLYPGGPSYTNPLLGGQELTFRCKTTVKIIAPVIVFQVFHGYGENLLDYNHNHFAFRIGLGFYLPSW